MYFLRDHQALAKKHQLQNDFFLVEVKNGPTWTGKKLRRLDAVAFKKSWTKPCITGYEIKISRSDFLNDEKWQFYLDYCHKFYFVCPSGLIKPEEIQIERVGLIWYNPEKKSLFTKKKAIFKPLEKLPTEMLYYILMSRVESDRDPFYKQRTKYFKDWLENKISNQQLGYQVSYRITELIEQAKRETRKWQKEAEKYKKEAEAFQAIMDILKKHGLGPQWYMENLAFEYPEILDKKLSMLNAKENSQIIEQTRKFWKNLNILFSK